MLIIPIQSISNIITNSSSEVFCTITADKDTLEQINDILSRVITDYDYSEDDPVLSYNTKEDKAEEGWYDDEDLAKMPDQWIEIHMPYSKSGCESFYRAGIKALLDINNIKDYKIVYE